MLGSVLDELLVKKVATEERRRELMLMLSRRGMLEGREEGPEMEPLAEPPGPVGAEGVGPPGLPVPLRSRVIGCWVMDGRWNWYW